MLGDENNTPEVRQSGILMTIIISLLATGVIDHVPVDDNPAYITMKRITLNKNTAYETVTIASHSDASALYETVK